MLISFWQV
uniref:Uncharacterized protein n=1 Tax=Arundo donax TaxID=35708 RepID=A0A0A8ZSR0_ARUDO